MRSGGAGRSLRGGRKFSRPWHFRINEIQSSLAPTMREDSSAPFMKLQENKTTLPEDVWSDATTAHFSAILAELQGIAWNGDIDSQVYSWYAHVPPHHQGSRFGSFGEDENCKVSKEAGLGINMWNGARHEVSELLACLFSKLVPNQDRADAFPQHGRDGDWMVELRSPGSWGVLRCWLLHNASMFCVQVAGAPCPCFPQYGESITRSSRDV